MRTLVGHRAGARVASPPRPARGDGGAVPARDRLPRDRSSAERSSTATWPTTSWRPSTPPRCSADPTRPATRPGPRWSTTSGSPSASSAETTDADGARLPGGPRRSRCLHSTPSTSRAPGSRSPRRSPATSGAAAPSRASSSATSGSSSGRIGATSGKVRKTPLVRVSDGEGRYAVIGSLGGAPTHPQWVHNVRAHPIARIQDGPERPRPRGARGRRRREGDLVGPGHRGVAGLRRLPGLDRADDPAVRAGADLLGLSGPSRGRSSSRSCGATTPCTRPSPAVTRAAESPSFPPRAVG